MSAVRCLSALMACVRKLKSHMATGQHVMDLLMLYGLRITRGCISLSWELSLSVSVVLEICGPLSSQGDLLASHHEHILIDKKKKK